MLNFAKFAAIAVLVLIAGLSLVEAQNKNKLDQFFSALSENSQFSGTVLIAERGKIFYEKSFGYADFPNQIRNNKNTSFPIASISKLFTATAILQLAEAGNLQTNDPAVKYLPAFPYPAITIKHLLSHTSGLPPYDDFFEAAGKEKTDRVFTDSDFLPALRANPKPLIYQPGEKANYDNINYLVLALIIEKISGESYENYIETHILKPAGMKNTRFLPFSRQYDPALKINHFAYAHFYPHLYSEHPVRANTIPFISNYWRAFNFQGFGDYISTTRDLLRFDQAVRNGKLLKQITLQEAYAPIKLNDGSENPDRFGLGWEVEKDSSLGQIVYHSGGATGLSCILLRNITKNQTIILFDNTHPNAHEVAGKALEILNSRQVPNPRKSLAAVYGQVLAADGIAAARLIFDKFRADKENYELSENDFNALGYDFMSESNPFGLPTEQKLAEALEVFRLNTELFPESWNVYDSYGEALLKAGKKDEAVIMYRKSIELNPMNENGKKVLEQLAKQDEAKLQ